ncbi:hypothetical protein BC833DRAFT_623931 [Globomyces pollinis-pini]|nr:hypothetical protein BC833DRAFT_623931 [Globomyces pollinis-pini]
MSSDLEEFDEQMVELLKSVQQVLEKDMPKLKGQERIEKCQYLRNRITRAKQVLRSIQVEIRGLSGDKGEWESKAKGYEEKVGKLSQDIEWAERTNSGGKDDAKPKHIDEMATGEITKMAMATQDKTQESAARAKKALDETLQIANATNAELKKQGEKIKEMEEGVEQVETNLKRADKQIRIFIRRMSSDKLFLMMVVLMVVCVLGALIIYILKKSCPQAVQGILCPAAVASTTSAAPATTATA